MKDERLERALAEASDGGGPPEGWQEKVLARIEKPVSRRRARWPLVVGGSGLLAAAAAVALFVGMRDRPAAPPIPAAGKQRVDALATRLEHSVEKLRELTDDAYTNLLAAQTEAEKARRLHELDIAKRQLEHVQRRLLQLRGRLPRVDDGKIAVKCDPNDPLCGVE